MASENQSNNKRVTRLKLAMESNITSLSEKPNFGTIEGSNNLQGKRKADNNLNKQHGVKRFALSNLTNAESENSLVQKPHKSSIPIPKAKQCNDSKPNTHKLKGATKILTRAAMRLEKALSNKKKTQGEQEKHEDNYDCENEHPSNRLDDVNQISVGIIGAFPSETIQASAKPSESDNTKLHNSKRQSSTDQVSSKCLVGVPSKASVMFHGEKGIKQLGTWDAKQAVRQSNDFEVSDNSLYVSAIESLDEESNVSSANLLDKASGKGKKLAALINQTVPTYELKKNDMTDKMAALTCSPVEENPIVPNARKATDIPSMPTAGTTNDNGQKTYVVELLDTKLKKQTSNELELSDDTLYVSAIDTLDEEVSSSFRRHSAQMVVNKGNDVAKPNLIVEQKVVEDQKLAEKPTITAVPSSPPKRTPPGIDDFDKTYWRDVNQVSEYAQDVFDYLRERESAYVLKDYMKNQPQLSHYMRALLVDWMVEIQESFELNHETLYLAVKIVDAYLSLVVIERETLQLLAAAALLIAAKYDERVPPTIDDFIYICDGAYVRQELLKMERTVFRTIRFDLGFPLSYRFLRRYARVALLPMPILTLARYILETSLMEYATVVLLDSKLACAALFIALRMSNQPGWNKTLEYYSGYKVEEFKNEAILLNNGLLPKKSSALNKLTNVREKYSHELFFQVAKRPVIATLEKLFDTTDLLFKVPAAVEASSFGRIPKSNDKSIVPQSAPQTSGTNGIVTPSTFHKSSTIDTALPSIN